VGDQADSDRCRARGEERSVPSEGRGAIGAGRGATGSSFLGGRRRDRILASRLLTLKQLTEAHSLPSVGEASFWVLFP
jgi:hypothetical protein